ncbi:MAG: hypothetical protein GY765_04175 [bacterium]|nr:hypothetical protein [bacterium]
MHWDLMCVDYALVYGEPVWYMVAGCCCLVFAVAIFLMSVGYFKMVFNGNATTEALLWRLSTAFVLVLCTKRIVNLFSSFYMKVFEGENIMFTLVDAQWLMVVSVCVFPVLLGLLAAKRQVRKKHRSNLFD